ncbi:unnamed protein product [Ambrosiozyma monospora]|uniref:Unnamed protein product n=1 Tax=Ambrosiozyma monospora TaxID=43982 RepID=A0A9W7DIC7_AMBMO|nr:unnamed protein product [Ambrosiozyma monospora]
MNESYFLTNSLQRLFAIFLHLCVAVTNLIISMLCVSRVFPISAAASGLIISYLASFSLMVIGSSRALGQLEQLLSSVERICEYAFDIPQEAQYDSDDFNKTPDTWPSEGGVNFTDVNLRYREGLPLVLNGLSIDIKPGEKIGICGRTGAGKSTIINALYRISEPDNGSTITIDGIDIQKIALGELRSRLSIIPQESVLFKGTVRSNLDPFSEFDDDTLYDALVRSGCIQPGLINRVKQQQFGEDGAADAEVHVFHLDNIVEDNGANYSLGQRQMLALCRALLRNSKILILDEATSSVDYETDWKVQEVISKEFNHCTILCIAHRLKTIVRYDRILVMDRGKLAEFDTPINLFKLDGIFRSMCNKSGISEVDFA